MDELCAALLAQVVPRTWFGRLFGAPARPLVLRFCAEMQGLSEFFRAIAAGLASASPVIPACRGDNDGLLGDAGSGRPQTVRPARGERDTPRPTCRVTSDAAAPLSADVLPDPDLAPMGSAPAALATTRETLIGPAPDCFAAEARADFRGSLPGSAVDRAGGVFFEASAHRVSHAHSVM